MVVPHDGIFSKYKILKIFYGKEIFLFAEKEKERLPILCLQKRKNVENDCSFFSGREQRGAADERHGVRDFTETKGSGGREGLWSLACGVFLCSARRLSSLTRFF